MSKINNSYLDFTKQYRNLNYYKVDEAYDRIDNPVTKLDNFLKTSIFSKKSEKTSIPQSEIYPKMKGTIKPDYFFIEHYPRFKYDTNSNLKLFGQKQTQFHSEIFDNIKQEFKQKNYSFHYEKDKITLQQESGLQLPKDRLKELQETKKEQSKFRNLRDEVDFLNRKKRILDGLHNDDENDIKSRKRNLSYDKYRNQNECFEFSNANNFVGQKMNSSFYLDRDWKSKKRCETLRFQDTFENIVSQRPKCLKINTERMNYLKFRENGGKDYKIVNLTKD